MGLPEQRFNIKKKSSALELDERENFVDKDPKDKFSTFFRSRYWSTGSACQWVPLVSLIL